MKVKIVDPHQNDPPQPLSGDIQQHEGDL